MEASPSAEDTTGVAEDHPAQVVVAVPQRGALAMAVKRLLETLFLGLTLPRLLFFHLNRLVWGRDRAFQAASESISRIPGERGVYMRQAFYGQTLDRCGRDCGFSFGCLYSMTAARLGDRVYTGRYCSIGFAEIESDVLLADGVIVLSGGREHGDPDGDTPSDRASVYSQVKIGTRTWIGSGAVIMADVGRRVTIGAGAVVTQPIPDDCVAVGVPARVVRRVESPPSDD